MEFWGVEVKSGKTYEVDLTDGKILHLSQASLGEIKNNKSESICLQINVENKKLVLGTLNPERLPQQLFDLVFDKNFTLSHNWKSGSVYFFGYKADQPSEQDDDSEEMDTDEEEEAMRLPLPVINGKKEVKKEVKSVVPAKKDAGKQKVKIVEPVKDDDDSEDSDLPDDSDSDEDDGSSDDDVKGSDEDEETPEKQVSAKKRPNESSSKTPTTDKKAKMSTPQKTDGKKPGGHVATPYPSKKPDKTPAASKSNQKNSASAAAGSHECKSCNRTFKNDGALQSHNQAKHK